MPSKQPQRKPRPVPSVHPATTPVAGKPLAPRKKISLQKRLVFGLIVAVVPPLIVLSFCELVVRVTGNRYPTSFIIKRDTDKGTVFTDNVKFGWQFFPPTIARRPHDFVLPAVKAPGTRRVFLFGESAAWGDPDPSFGPARILQVLLNSQFPELKFDVINAAMAAINSHVVLKIAKSAAEHQPDFFVVYMGNNEVIGPYGPGTVFSSFSSNLNAIRTTIDLKEMGVFQLLTDLRIRAEGRAKQPMTWAGMQMFLENQVPARDPRMEVTYSHFRSNLTDIIRVGKKAGAVPMVCTMAANYNACAPFGSLHQPDLPIEALTRWEAAYSSGTEALNRSDATKAIESFLLALETDDQYANLHYQLANAYELQKDYGRAKKYYQRAIDTDTLRFRSDTSINSAIRAASKEEAATLVDVQALFEKESPNGLPGAALLVDHVHMNFHGNYLIARAVAQEIAVALKKGSVPSWLAEEDCAARLAYTKYNAYRVAERNYQRLKNPPFTNQLNHAQQKDRLVQELDSLRPTSGNQLAEAVPMYEAAITSAPEDWVLHENFADLLQRLGDPVREAAELQKVLELMPHHQERHAWLGQSMLNQGKLDVALQSYEKALVYDANNEAAHKGRGAVLMRQGKVVEALKAYGDAVDANPKSAENYNDLGQAFQHTQRIDDAVKAFKKAVELNPEMAAARTNLAVIMLNTNQLPEATAELEAAVKTDPGYAQAQRHLGNAYFQAGKFKEAIGAYQAAVKLAPHIAEIHNNLASAYAYLKRNKEAITELRQAVLLDPQAAQVHKNLALLLLEEGLTEEAQSEFRKTLALDPMETETKVYLDKLESQAK